MFLSVCNGMSLVLVLSFGVSRFSVLCLVPRNSTGSTWVGPNLRLAQDQELQPFGLAHFLLRYSVKKEEEDEEEEVVALDLSHCFPEVCILFHSNK